MVEVDKTEDNENMKEHQVEQDILNAAMKVFVEKGKAGARMQEIADCAGVNKMLLHYYFKDKDTLFLEVLKRIVVDLYGNVFHESMTALPFKEFLSVFIDRHFDFLNERKDSFQFLLWELSRQKRNLRDVISDCYIGYRQTPFKILTDKLNEAIASGEIREVDTTEFILNLFSLDLFMFLALPVIQDMMPMDDEQLTAALERRKKEVFRLLWNDIGIN